jgi:hypothetical protein
MPVPVEAVRQGLMAPVQLAVVPARFKLAAAGAAATGAAVLQREAVRAVLLAARVERQRTALLAAQAVTLAAQAAPALLAATALVAAVVA